MLTQQLQRTEQQVDLLDVGVAAYRIWQTIANVGDHTSISRFDSTQISDVVNQQK